MKEPAKDVNQFSELEISESSQANVLAHEKAKSNPNLLSTSADENKNKKPFFLRQVIEEVYSKFHARIKTVLQAYSQFYDRYLIIKMYADTNVEYNR